MDEGILSGDKKNRDIPPSLAELFDTYYKLKREVLVVTGIGDTTEREGVAERRAGVRTRQNLKFFFENYPEKEDLPVFIHLEDDSSKYRRYFFPRTNEIVSISSEIETPNLLPESKSFAGLQTVKHLLVQNEQFGTPLQGVHIEDLIVMSEEKALSRELDGYEIYEQLKNQDIVAIIEFLGQCLVSPESKARYAILLKHISDIQEEREIEQQTAEGRYVVAVKQVFIEIAGVIKSNFTLQLPDQIPLRTKEDYELEARMKGIGKSFVRSMHKQGLVRKEDNTRDTMEESSEWFPQIYFHPGDASMEIIPVEKGALGKLREVPENARQATAREFLENKWQAISKLRERLPEDINLELPLT